GARRGRARPAGAEAGRSRRLDGAARIRLQGAPRHRLAPRHPADRGSPLRRLPRRGLGPPGRNGVDRSEDLGGRALVLPHQEHLRGGGLAARQPRQRPAAVPPPPLGAAVRRLWSVLFDRRKLALALLLLAGAAKAQEVACKAVLAGTRALVVATSARDLPLTWSEERGVFELDGRALPDPDHIALERIALALGETEDPRA